MCLHGAIQFSGDCAAVEEDDVVLPSCNKYIRFLLLSNYLSLSEHPVGTVDSLPDHHHRYRDHHYDCFQKCTETLESERTNTVKKCWMQ